MKEFVITFLVVFIGGMGMLYVFGTDRDILGMLVVSGLTALIMALVAKFLKKYAVGTIRKITKRLS